MFVDCRVTEASGRADNHEATVRRLLLCISLDFKTRSFGSAPSTNKFKMPFIRCGGRVDKRRHNEKVLGGKR